MKYKVGDKVRVKSLKRLVEEFGVNECGDIGTEVYFTEDMKEYCGKNVTIHMTFEDGKVDTYSIEEDNHRWDWSEDMFEDVEEYFITIDSKEGIFSGKRNNVNHPPHYNDGNIEVIDYIEDKKLGFHLGNAIKYISRAGKKDKAKTREDIEKAIWYLKRYLEVE